MDVAARSGPSSPSATVSGAPRTPSTTSRRLLEESPSVPRVGLEMGSLGPFIPRVHEDDPVPPLAPLWPRTASSNHRP